MSRTARRHMRQLAAGLPQTNYDANVLAAGPVAYWTLGGGSAGVADKTGKGHTGTSMGGFAVTSFLDGTTATVFDGATQYIEVADADDLSIPTTGILTIEAWIRPDVIEFPNDESTGYVHWMGKGSTGQAEYVARMYSYTNTENPPRPNRISGYAFNLSGGLGTGGYFQDTVIPGEWIHYVFVVNTVDTDANFPTGYGKIYRNGVQRDKDPLSAYNVVPGNGTHPLRIGTRDFNSFFLGAIAKVAIYDYEPSAIAIRDRYQMMVPPVLGSAAFIRHVASATTKTTGNILSLTVPEPGVSEGSTLIVKVVHAYTAGAPSIIDSRGNTYTRDRSAPNGTNTIRASLFSAPVNAALQPGDSIQLTTTASVDAKTMSIDEFSGIVFTSNVDQVNSAGGSSTTPGDPNPAITTTQADDLLVGFVAVNGPTEDVYNEDSLNQWNSLTRTGTTGDVATSNVTANSAYKTVNATSQYRYKPTLGTSQSWVEIIAAYKAGTPVVTPPPTGTAVFIQNIGTASTKTVGTIQTITVPVGGVQVDHTLIVRVLTDYTTTAPTVTDTRGNTYVRDRTSGNATDTIRAAIYSCRVTTALQEGDTITITAATSVAARVAAVDEFANVLVPISIDNQNGAGGTSTAPSVNTTTTNANDLLIGFVSVESDVSDTFTENTINQWTSLTRVGTTGDASDTNVTANGAYRAAGSIGTYTYAPTLGTSANWIDFIVAYRAQ